MEQEKSLQLISQSETQRRSASLIKEWLFRFGIEHKEEVAPRLPMWIEALGSIEPILLEKLFVRAFRTLKFFPKISEILAPIQKAKESSAPQEAEQAWQEALDLRREIWNPDIPRRLDFALTTLPERNRRALRAANIFRDFEDLDALHVWAKKRFVESFLAYDKLLEDQFFLPEGDFKESIAELARAKSLPPLIPPQKGII